MQRRSTTALFTAVCLLSTLQIAADAPTPYKDRTAGLKQAWSCVQKYNEHSFPQAEAECNALLPYLEAQVGPDAPEVAQTLELMGSACSEQKKYEQAARAYKRALAIREVKLGPKAPETMEVLHRLACSYLDQDKYSQAEPLFLRWVEQSDTRPISAVDKLFEQLLKEAEGAVNAKKMERLPVVLEGAISLSDHNGGPLQKRVLAPLTWLGRARESQNRLDEARRLYERAVELHSRLIPHERSDLFWRLLDLAKLLRRMHHAQQALAAYVRARDVAAKLPGSEEEANSHIQLCVFLQEQQMYTDADGPCHTAVVKWEQRAKLGKSADGLLNSRVNLANLLRKQQKFEESEAMFQRALKEAQSQAGFNFAALYNSLGGLYEDWQRYEEAEKSYRQAVDSASATKDQKMTEICLDNLAGLMHTLGRFPEALGYTNRALEVTRSIQPADPVRIADHLSRLAAISFSQDRPDQALDYGKQVLATRRAYLEQNDPRIAETLNNMGIFEKEMGNHVESEAAYKLALTIYESRKDQRGIARVLANLSTLLSAEGQWARADQLALQALSIRRKELQEDHSDVASSLNGLAVLYLDQGEYTQALSYARQAVEAAKRVPRANPLLIAQYQYHEGNILEAMKKYDQAQAIYDQTLVARRKLLPDDHIDILITKNSMGGLAYLQHDYKRAATIFQQVLDTMEKRSSGRPDARVGALNNLALSLQRQGQTQSAEQLFLRALASLRERPSFIGPQLEQTLGNLAILRLARGQVDAALTLLHQTVERQEAALRSSLSESRTLALLNLERGTEDVIYGLLPQYADQPASRHLAMALTLLRKGWALEVGSVASLAIRRSLTSSAQKKRFQDWREVLEKRERMLLLGPQKLSQEAYEQALSELDLSERRLYHELTLDAHGADVSPPLQLDQVVAQVAGKLPRNSVLLEIVRARPHNAAATGKMPIWGEPQYIALLLHPDGRITAGQPVPQKKVDDQVAAALTQLSDGSGKPLPALNQLFSFLIQPLEAALQGSARIYVSADGGLNLIPWDALYDGSRYLIDRYEIRYLTSGRDLLRSPQAGSGHPALILANPAFGEPGTSPPGTATAGGMYALMQNLSSLPWTPIEAKFIANLFQTVAKLGPDATEAAIRAAPAPSVLHIATHGIFRVEDGGAGGAGTRSPSRTLGSSGTIEPDKGVRDVLSGKVADPLSNSALALAGAAHAARASSTVNDGILTAEEVRGLDMHGTELVTLSACETGRGLPAVGQGVYGLRRAFQIAGAQALVSSLWKVADEQTNSLMRSYYSRLLSGRPRISALREAMLDIKTCNPSPHHWAPFIAIGDDLPLTKTDRSRIIVSSCKQSQSTAPR